MWHEACGASTANTVMASVASVGSVGGMSAVDRSGSERAGAGAASGAIGIEAKIRQQTGGLHLDAAGGNVAGRALEILRREDNGAE